MSFVKKLAAVAALTSAMTGFVVALNSGEGDAAHTNRHLKWYVKIGGNPHYTDYAVSYFGSGGTDAE
jgi:hypothetical protein